jgi:hypothetical protein
MIRFLQPVPQTLVYACVACGGSSVWRCHLGLFRPCGHCRNGLRAFLYVPAPALMGVPG